MLEATTVKGYCVDDEGKHIPVRLSSDGDKMMRRAIDRNTDETIKDSGPPCSRQDRRRKERTMSLKRRGRGRGMRLIKREIWRRGGATALLPLPLTAKARTRRFTSPLEGA